MDSILKKLDLVAIKRDIAIGIQECSQRGLYHSTKWLAELNFSISHIKINPEDIAPSTNEIGDEYEEYQMAKTCFDTKEYDRSVYFTKDCSTPRARFLHLYSKYVSSEKKKIDSMTDANCPPDPTKNSSLKELSAILEKDYQNNTLDGYGLYLYGVVLKKLDLHPLAIDIFIEAIRAAPIHWGAWLELSPLILDTEQLKTIKLPDHWIKPFFMAHSYLEQLCNEEALEIYYHLMDQGFQESNYLLAQTAIVYHNKRDLDKAISSFKDLLIKDPYRLDNLDTYSNLLYVKELKTELADLAHKAVTVDRYRVETCCVIGNYYSLRSDHQKAVLYFQRALKLNPQYLSAWTLMGHEFMEMKNTNAAIQSYRHALEVNRRDYRAWYGLGQTYEILKMPHYCLYYYKQAQQLRPNDSRMVIALGETYEKLDKIENALKCYYKACNLGDIEGMALLKLAKLYDKLNDSDNAAAAYTEYFLKEDEHKSVMYDDQNEFYAAVLFLANYHLKKDELDQAYNYAYRCLENEETKKQGEALLKTIAQRRGANETSAMDETNISDTSMLPADIIFSPTNT